MIIIFKNILNKFKDMYTKFVFAYIKKSILSRYDTEAHRKINSDYTLSSSQIKEVDDYYKKHYGKKIDNRAHREYSSFSKKFYKEYFPEYIFIAETSNYFNLWSDYVSCLSDKNIMDIIAKQAGVETAKTLYSCVKGHYRNEHGDIIKKKEFLKNVSDLGSVFCKPSIDSNAGRGCFVGKFINGINRLSNKPIYEEIEQLGTDFVIQEVVNCHASIKKLYPNSCNTFRIVTYFWKGSIYTMPSFLRLGRNNSFIDNVCAGGLYVGINDEGVLNKYAYTEHGEQHTFHENTKVVFENYKICLFPSVITAAKKIHSFIPQTGIIFWDFTLSKSGNPLFIEANFKDGGIWANQIANGLPAFGERTAEILDWTREMNKSSTEKRKKELYKKVFDDN